MAKKKAEVLENTQEIEIVETIEETEQVDVVEVVNTVDELVNSFKEVIEEFKDTTPIEELSYSPKDIVEFYNLRGDLKYAPYAYITKRGYTALRKYTKKK